ncbi:MAG: hypothetical protein IKF14_05120 [Atopobiaceae bacterium]|nr:hypothetical protein [Atopobiaceae bacterium]MBR3158470.1 hypothetical protein [Atopobiaceae bacterium]
MTSLERENAELREQLRVLGSNYDALLKELRSMPQPAEPVDLGDGMFECVNDYTRLDTEWRYCPWCGSEIDWNRWDDVEEVWR